MSTAATTLSSKERLAVLFDEVAELTGQRNAIDGRLVEIIAEIDHDGIWGNTGCRSIPALVAWKTGMSLHNAGNIATIAHRLPEFPLCAAGMREGRLSVDQVGVIAEGGAEGSDAHYAQLASVATVSQLRTAIKLAPRPDPDPTPTPKPERSISKTVGQTHTTWTIRLPHAEGATFDAGLQSHTDALVAQWKRENPGYDGETAAAEDRDRDAKAGHTVYDLRGQVVRDPIPDRGPFPTQVDGFMSLVEAGWDADVARRPHGQRTTVVVHLDVDKPAALHLGPLLSGADRRYLLCDATCEAWFERDGRVIGSGRETRTISRRLRRALEHRDRCCAVPGCGATRGLHAHHIRHWEDGGPTELWNLVLLCPYHHRLHHAGGISISGDADRLVVTDADGEPPHPGSLARPPTTAPPAVPPCPGPLGERADWWWYTPYEPQPPTSN